MNNFEQLQANIKWHKSYTYRALQFLKSQALGIVGTTIFLGILWAIAILVLSIKF